MHSQDMQVLAALQGWAAEGHRAALVTVARTWGSAPRPAGAWMALRDDGRVQGSVSGGCIEDDLGARMRDGRIAVVGVRREFHFDGRNLSGFQPGRVFHFRDT